MSASDQYPMSGKWVSLPFVGPLTETSGTAIRNEIRAMFRLLDAADQLADAARAYTGGSVVPMVEALLAYDHLKGDPS